MKKVKLKKMFKKSNSDIGYDGQFYVSTRGILWMRLILFDEFWLKQIALLSVGGPYPIS